MGTWGKVALLALVGCGRVGFDSSGGPVDAGMDAPGDVGDAIADVAPEGGGGGDADAGPRRIVINAVATPTIAPTMFTSFAVEDFVRADRGFCGAGSFGGEIVIDGVARVAVGDDDVWFACFGADLGLSWLETFGTRGSDNASQLVRHSSGDIVLRGLVEGAADLGGGTERFFGSDDWFVARYTVGGAFVDAEVYGGANDDDFGGCVAARDDGTLVLAGACAPGVDLGGGTLSNLGGRDACMAILDGTDTHLASFAWGGAQEQYVTGVAELAPGLLVVTASVAGDLDLGSDVASSVGDADAVLFIVSDAGVVERYWTISGPLEQFAQRPVVDGDGNIYVVGSSAGDADFGDGLRTIPRTDAFVASYARDGSFRWVQLFGGTADGSTLGDNLKLGDDGRIYAVGGIYAGGTIGGVPVESAGERDAFVVAIEPDGTLAWSKVFGGAMNDRIGAVAILASGELVVGGYFSESAVLDGLAVELPAGGGVVFAKLGSE